MFEWRGPLSEKVVVESIGEIELRPLGGADARAGSEDDNDVLVTVPLKGLVGI